MVNRNDEEKTYLDDSYDTETVINQDIASDETYIPEKMMNAEILNKNTQVGNYIIEKVLSTKGAQANVYLVKNCLNNNKYVLKMYKTNFFPQEQIINLFKNSSCPYVIHIIEDGMFNEQYYEITQYYEKGNLNQKKEYKAKFLDEVIVPCVNEGLHYLHGHNELGIHIIHGDLKPDNIYISDDEQFVIIGDLGISVLTNKTGTAIDSIKGTPEFSPLTIGFYKQVIKTSAYDYASLGLILFKLHYGYSLFGNMSEEEIINKWNNGFTIPDSSHLRLDSLIRGLLNKNEKERFNYEDVKKWCEYEFVDAKHKKLYCTYEPEDVKEKSNYIFGVFSQKVLSVNSLETMAIAMRENWEQARKVIKRENFLIFLNEFDETVSHKYKELLNEKTVDIVIFIFINEFCVNNEIIYKGYNLGNIKEFFENFDNYHLLKMELFESGVISEIVENNDVYSQLNNNLQRVLDTNVSIERKNKFIHYLFNQEEELVIYGQSIHTIEEFVNIFIQLDKEEIFKIIEKENFASWLYIHGMGKDALNLL